MQQNKLIGNIKEMEDQMVIKGNVKIIKGEKQKPNIHLVFKRLGFT